MRKIACVGVLLVCAFHLKAQTNLVLNGSFELNSATQCINNLDSKVDYDNAISSSKHFGNKFTTVLINGACLVCSPPVLWGAGAKDGGWLLTIHGRDEVVVLPPPDDTIHLIKQGKISLALAAPLLSTKRYKLSFWIKDPPPEPNCIYTKNNYVNVGISNYEDSLGRHLLTTNYGDTIWKEYTWVFETQNAEEHITVTVGVNGTIDYGVFIDNFVLTETDEHLSTAINEIPQQEKILIKIVDVLGKETKATKGQVLFYIFSDGTVEKRVIIY